MPLQARTRPRKPQRAFAEHSRGARGAPVGPKRKHSNINRLWSSLDVASRLLGGPKGRRGRTKTIIKRVP
eukprot:9373708-Alexandrium_andersonii.AAC.1